MNDADLMQDAVVANPLDETVQLVAADAITEQTGDYDGALRDMKMLALATRITEFVKHLDEVQAKHYKDQNYTFAPPPTHAAQYTSDKWCRIVRREFTSGAYRDTSAVAFISLLDGYTRTMGTLIRGGVYKPASFRKPAKHARGNVMDPDFGSPVGASGHINYLR